VKQKTHRRSFCDRYGVFKNTVGHRFIPQPLHLLKPMIHLAAYQPDIPQNLGALLRLGACMGVDIHVIEPCGFPLDDKRMRRAGMDYMDHVVWHRHDRWEMFHAHCTRHQQRIVLMTTKGAVPHTEFRFQPGDMIVLGRESAGVPDAVHQAADARLIIPINPKVRSLNVAMSAAIVTGEALRQCGGFACR